MVVIKVSYVLMSDIFQAYTSIVKYLIIKYRSKIEEKVAVICEFYFVLTSLTDLYFRFIAF